MNLALISHEQSAGSWLRHVCLAFIYPGTSHRPWLPLESWFITSNNAALSCHSGKHKISYTFAEADAKYYRQLASTEPATVV